MRIVVEQRDDVGKGGTNRLAPRLTTGDDDLVEYRLEIAAVICNEWNGCGDVPKGETEATRR